MLVTEDRERSGRLGSSLPGRGIRAGRDHRRHRGVPRWSRGERLRLCAGTDVIALEPARDYKRLLAGDEGPNTGGMGAFSPVSDLPEGLVDHTIDKVIKPVLATMASPRAPRTPGFSMRVWS